MGCVPYMRVVYPLRIALILQIISMEFAYLQLCNILLQSIDGAGV